MVDWWNDLTWNSTDTGHVVHGTCEKFQTTTFLARRDLVNWIWDVLVGMRLPGKLRGVVGAFTRLRPDIDPDLVCQSVIISRNFTWSIHHNVRVSMSRRRCVGAEQRRPPCRRLQILPHSLFVPRYDSLAPVSEDALR